jgi:3-ketosteroid 9alpha-monooxygenase subunit B
MTLEAGIGGSGASERDTVPAFVVLHAKNKKFRQAYHAGDTLLEVSRRAGVPIPTTCTMGECGTCTVRLLRGRVRMHRNQVLSDADLTAGLVLGCQSVPVSGECEIEYD